MIFRDRREAGRQLAAQLLRFAGRDDVIVLALPRGGVPVGAEVARSLRVPLDVFIVRKLGVPGREELAMGAIASGDVTVINDDVVNSLQISQDMIDRTSAAEKIELHRREREYRLGAPAPEFRGKTVILVDDGLATGSTMRAAVLALRHRHPAQIVVAVPVGARDTCLAMNAIADDVVCLQSPDQFLAVGAWYTDFTQTTDEEVRELLAAANAEFHPQYRHS